MRTAPGRLAPFTIAVAMLAFALAGCRAKPVRMDAVRDALISKDPSAAADLLRALPVCPDAPPVALAPGQPGPLDKACLSEIANAFGSRSGFSATPPDQASLTTAAVLVARDGRGDQVAHADTWLSAMKSGKGVGVDALRAAVSRAMEQAAPTVGTKIEGDAASRQVMRVIAAAIPGACPTYRILGRGDDLGKLAPELGPDNSACVQRDLARREGPGAGYAAGVPRALEGALALWRETERALRLGAPASEPTIKARLDARLETIEAATVRIATNKVTATVTAPVALQMGELHAQAGVLLWRDAGVSDGGSEGGIPKGIPVATPFSVPTSTSRATPPAPKR